MSRDWLAADKKTLERWYPIGGATAVQPRLRRVKSRGAIWKAAERWGIKGPKSRPHAGTIHAKLSPEMRAALRFDRETYFPGMSYAEIAKTLGISEVSVWRHIKYGKEFGSEE